MTMTNSTKYAVNDNGENTKEAQTVSNKHQIR